MKLIAGLGNPGREYERTPHNIGYDVVELIRSKLEASWQNSRRFQARIAKTTTGKGEQVMLAQPLTFMNRSGNAVASLLRYHGCTAADLVVIMDDADLPLGQLRIKPDGGSGGHRGVASIIETLGTEKFVRVRLGVGRASASYLASYVLTSFSADNWEISRELVAEAAEAVNYMLNSGVEMAMNRYNCRKPAGEVSASSEQKGL